MAFNRHLQVKNNLLDKNVKPEDNEWGLYLDANNLYGYSMSRPLPTGGFKMFDNEEDLKNRESYLLNLIKNYDIDNDTKGYAFNVNVTIPKEKHDYLNGYCPFPELKIPEDEMVSNFNKKAFNATHKGKFKSSKKLILDLCDKKKLYCSY